MQRPGFWIAVHPEPDTPILGEAEIDLFNRHIREQLGTVRDLAALPAQRSGREVRDILYATLEKQRFRTRYLADGTRADQAFFDPIQQNMALDHLPDNLVLRHAVTTRLTAQRLLPTRKGLFVRPGDSSFDRLQNSALDLGTPLAAWHRSLDGAWVYADTALSSGWVHKDDLAWCDRETWHTFVNPQDYVTALRAKVDIFADPQCTVFLDWLRMGARLPITISSRNIPRIILPRRSPDGLMPEACVFAPPGTMQRGTLPCTPRHIFTQALEMLHQPYGWGGLAGEQDCSRFLQQVFATVGIDLPRNSAAQAQVGTALPGFHPRLPAAEKERLLVEKAVGGTALLYVPGHIMLYLGAVDGRAYAVHATWGYQESEPGGERLQVIGRVAVTDLHLGAGTRRGSLLERLNAVRLLVRPSP